MSSSPLALSIRSASKAYRISERGLRPTTLAESAMAWLKRPLARSVKTFWALRDVSFDVNTGDVVGVVGRNGAGKSSLLKVLSRITPLTSGTVELYGSVGSLLEVGTGFHQELTGRENVFLNGSILGMSRRDIKQQFDDIIDFSGVGAFVDTPVKRYSSGMYVRLAFAVAAHLRSDILLVDEVLAVGDGEFQRKCLGKIREMAGGGRTVVFVSHDMSAVRALCQRAVLLSRGKVAAIGSCGDVLQAYADEAKQQGAFHFVNPTPGDPAIARAAIVAIDEDHDSVRMEVELWTRERRTVALDVRLADSVGAPVAYGSLGAFDPAGLLHLESGRTCVTLEHDLRLLANGSYRVSLDLTVPDVEYLERNEDCLFFDWAPRARATGGRRVAQKWSKGSWELPTAMRQVQRVDGDAWAATDFGKTGD